MNTRITIVEVARARDVLLVACDVNHGEIQNGMVFDVVARPESWRIIGMTPAKLELYQQGRWGLTLAPLQPGQNLVVGDVLYDVPATGAGEANDG